MVGSLNRFLNLSGFTILVESEAFDENELKARKFAV